MPSNIILNIPIVVYYNYNLLGILNIRGGTEGGH